MPPECGQPRVEMPQLIGEHPRCLPGMNILEMFLLAVLAF